MRGDVVWDDNESTSFCKCIQLASCLIAISTSDDQPNSACFPRFLLALFIVLRKTKDTLLRKSYIQRHVLSKDIGYWSIHSLILRRQKLSRERNLKMKFK